MEPRLIAAAATLLLCAGCAIVPHPGTNACLPERLGVYGANAATVATALHDACQHWRIVEGRDTAPLLEGLTVYVVVAPELEECSPGAIACIVRDAHDVFRILVPQDSATWSYVYHEGLHLMLYRAGVPEADHHPWMKRTHGPAHW